ncbi:hypothetical protein AADG42_09320 [Ammonicoccus fulvus]|uniref:C-type lysozyme inhibitor domain-containing protein n=1 Tax=Ammonicoccus fulvus TaxID=3138240 RepID=A0ABZ3FN71_9ACTN
MKKIIATAFAAALLATGLTASQAYAAPVDITASYGCNSATFTNKNDQAVNVNYGTASSGDVRSVTVPAGKSVKVNSKSKNFGYTATLPNGTEVGLVPWPGVDLTAECAEADNQAKAKKFTVSYSCNAATFTNNTGGPVTLQHGQQNSGDTNKVTIANGKTFTAKSTANNFGWLAKDANGRTINVQEGGINLQAKCTATTKPTKPAKPAKKTEKGGLAKTGV